jgi:hypothetical protein
MEPKIVQINRGQLSSICEECYGGELCDGCRYIPRRAICFDCGLVKNHTYSPSHVALTLDISYYRCYWCGCILKNNRKNRREHGQKCIGAFSMKKVCRCEKICVSCLRKTTHRKYYFNCGCTYCGDCDVGYAIIQPYMPGYCAACSLLGFEIYVKKATEHYKKCANAEKLCENTNGLEQMDCENTNGLEQMD